MIPAAHTHGGGRPRTVDLRDVVKTSVSRHRSGCQGEMRPHDWRPKSPVDDYFARWRDDGTWAKRLERLREQPRRHAGREPTPRAACLASPSVKTTERGGRERGYAGGKKVTGRQRPLVVDTVGLLMGVLITSAGLDDGVAAPQRLQLIAPNELPRLATSVADTTDHHQVLHPGMSEHRPTWRIAVQTRPAGSTGVTPRAKRGGVERTNAWHGRSRRQSKDDERPPESSAALIYVSTIHLRLRRLTSHRRPEFHARSMTADALKLAS